MAEQTAEKKLLQWHPAFCAGLQIEFAEEAEKLTFESEHQLSKKPMEIDVLIIKKRDEDQIRKNIGRIFRKHNIIEYKSPEDYLSIDDFYKVYGYACFYKSDVPKVDLIKANETLFEEVKGEDMCEALRELFHDEIEEARTKEKRDTLLGLLRDGLLSVADVAARLGVTENEVQAMLGN